MVDKVTPVLYIPQVVNMLTLDGPGVYILGNDENGFVPKYVGRSDVSVKHRLLTHNHMYDYDYFIFKHVKSPKEAFFYEAKWWHDCQIIGIDLDNKIHPDAPTGMNIECPFCSFKKSALESIRKAG